MSSISPDQIDAILRGLAGPPPPGIVPDFHDVPDLRARGVAVFALCSGLTTLTYLLRISTRLATAHKLNASDYAVTFSWVGFLLPLLSLGGSPAQALFVGLAVVAWIVFEGIGWGKETWNISFKSFSESLFYIYIGGVIYVMLACSVRISILLQYVEVFALSTTRRGLWRTCYLIIWVNIFIFIITFCLWIVQCHPIIQYWDPLVTTGSCVYWAGEAPYIVSGAINSSLDIFLLVPPQLVVWKLQASFHKRLAISAIFLVGAFACATLLARIYYNVRLYHTDSHAYYLYAEVVCCMLETGLGIIAACLPTVPKFCRTVKEQHFGAKALKTIQIGISTVQSALSISRHPSATKPSVCDPSTPQYPIQRPSRTFSPPGRQPQKSTAIR